MSHTQDLLNWYYLSHRRLPWRETSDPYKIWISEIMLQQTQVDTVIDYFNRFITAFPTVTTLAQADEAEIFKLWEGLGYYARARNLMACAKKVVESHDGKFPEDYETMLKLPGIGPYTAGAVLSIAFNKPYPAVDGNVMRVYSRLFNLEDDIAQPKTRKKIEALAKEHLPDDCRHYNQALMELGALICKPKQPDCLRCPVSRHCRSRAAETQHRLPVKAKKAEKKTLRMAVALVENDGQLFIVKRQEKGLLHGLWGLPLVEFSPDGFAAETLAAYLKAHYGLHAKEPELIGMKKHVFTHLVWEMNLYRLKLEEIVLDSQCRYGEHQKWISFEEIHAYAFPSAFHKLFGLI